MYLCISYQYYRTNIYLSIPSIYTHTHTHTHTHIDDDGLCQVGEIIDPNHVLVNKWTPPAPELKDHTRDTGTCVCV